MKKIVSIMSLLCVIVNSTILCQTVEAHHGSKCLKVHFNRALGETGGVQAELGTIMDLSQKKLSVWMKVPREAADVNMNAKIFIFDDKWNWGDAGPDITSFNGKGDQWVELVWDLSINPPSKTGFPNCDPTRVRIVGVLIGEWTGGNWSGYLYIDSFGWSDPDGQNYEILFDFERNTEGWTGWGSIDIVDIAETTSTEIPTPIPTPTPPSSETIRLSYDFSKRRGQSYRWVDVNGDGRYDYRIDLCNWNINSAAGGEINMTYNKNVNKLVTEANLWGAQPQNYVNGYPEIYVGRKPWDGQYANGLGVNFPYKVSDLISNNMSLIVSFSVDLQSLNPDMNFNIAADAWLVDENYAFKPGSGLSTPYVEIMVWVFNHNLGPAGGKIGEETVSGKSWEVWRSVRSDNSTYIAIIPRGWSLTKGSISYDIAEVIRVVKKYIPFDISNYYLVGWELGTEWGTKGSGGVAQFKYTISNYTVIQTSPASIPTPTLTPTPALKPTPTFEEFVLYVIILIVLIVAVLLFLTFLRKKAKKLENH